MKLLLLILALGLSACATSSTPDPFDTAIAKAMENMFNQNGGPK